VSALSLVVAFTVTACGGGNGSNTMSQLDPPPTAEIADTALVSNDGIVYS